MPSVDLIIAAVSALVGAAVVYWGMSYALESAREDLEDAEDAITGLRKYLDSLHEQTDSAVHLERAITDARDSGSPDAELDELLRVRDRFLGAASQPNPAPSFDPDRQAEDHSDGPRADSSPPV